MRMRVEEVDGNVSPRGFISSKEERKCLKGVNGTTIFFIIDLNSFGVDFFVTLWLLAP